MRSKAADSFVSNSSSVSIRVVRRGLMIYLLSAVALPVICFIFGWRSLDTIAAGFIYGSLGLALFGALTFAANTVSAQLSRLSLPRYNPPSLKRLQEDERDESKTGTGGKNLLFATLIGGALLLLTGLFLNML